MNIELRKDEIQQLMTALKDSGLEYTDNLILYSKLTDLINKD